MRQVFKLSAFLFSLFIIFAICKANLGGPSIFKEWVNALPFQDKGAHFLLFGVFALLLNGALNFSRIRLLGIRFYKGAFFLFLFVALEELSQGLISTRTMDIHDFAADMMGIVVFSMVTVSIEQYAKKV